MAAGRIVLPGWMPALDNNGAPIPNAQIYFYLNGTTTLATVYSNSSLTTPLANPVLANSSGQFPEIWADDANLFSVSVAAPYGPAGIPFSFNGVGPATAAAVTEAGAEAGAAAANAVVATKADKSSVFSQTLTTYTNASLQAAHDALPSTGGVINVPPGVTVSLTGAVTLSKPNVVLRTNGATFDIAYASGDGIVVSGANFVADGVVNITSSVVRTGGRAFTAVGSADNGLVTIKGEKQFILFDIDGPRKWTATVYAKDGVSGGAYVRMGATARSGEHKVRLVVDPFTAADYVCKGFVFKYVDDIDISGSKVLKCSEGIEFSPGAGQSSALVTGTSLNIDTNTRALLIAPTSSGAVVRNDFSGWFGTNATGVVSEMIRVDASGGAVDNLTLDLRSRNANGIAAGTFLKVIGSPTNINITDTSEIADYAVGVDGTTGLTGFWKATRSNITSAFNGFNPLNFQVTDWQLTSGLTVSAGSGTITTASANARWLKTGKRVDFKLNITVTNNGTGAAILNVSGIPWSNLNEGTCIGVDRGATGQSWVGQFTGATTMGVRRYDGAYPAVSGAVCTLSGVSEVA